MYTLSRESFSLLNSSQAKMAHGRGFQDLSFNLIEPEMPVSPPRPCINTSTCIKQDPGPLQKYSIHFFLLVIG
jgi:hypothetical protein